METAGQPEHEARMTEVRARLAEFAEGDPSPAERALMLRLLRSFTARTPGAVDLLARLLEAGDPEPVSDHAHSLKGSAANIGAIRLAALCATVEDGARAGIVADPGHTVERLRAEAGGALLAVRAVTEGYEESI
ncbi:Hpt domain-containing protein [Actinoplanes hulinensis]|uniref:Hpt domain-containing protein n=1 Tax=Actinoplanes hulinensis TaxID=1144547 RepID=A0ABS7B2R9_9ACTN|nr:Hpt domain-containing protein [Actinoplanes hulinensis]MBW6434603.1 Hpt domain-containing protein [Actinoplanes hulinensis]